MTCVGALWRGLGCAGGAGTSGSLAIGVGFDVAVDDEGNMGDDGRRCDKGLRLLEAPDVSCGLRGLCDFFRVSSSSCAFFLAACTSVSISVGWEGPPTQSASRTPVGDVLASASAAGTATVASCPAPPSNSTTLATFRNSQSSSYSMKPLPFVSHSLKSISSTSGTVSRPSSIIALPNSSYPIEPLASSSNCRNRSITRTIDAFIAPLIWLGSECSVASSRSNPPRRLALRLITFLVRSAILFAARSGSGGSSGSSLKDRSMTSNSSRYSMVPL